MITKDKLQSLSFNEWAGLHDKFDNYGDQGFERQEAFMSEVLTICPFLEELLDIRDQGEKESNATMIEKAINDIEFWGMLYLLGKKVGAW